MKLKIILLISAIMTLDVSALNAPQPIIMSYWSNAKQPLSYPIPGSLDATEKLQHNPDLIAKLSYINLLAYAFLQVNKDGDLHFSDSTVDLGPNDAGFCQHFPQICQDNQAHYTPKYGNFRAFAVLKLPQLAKLISVGGANSEASFYNAMQHPHEFMDSATTIITQYQLNGIDLDFELNALFTPTEAEQYRDIITQLRQKLGPNMLITLEVAPDPETQRSIGRKNWAVIANNVNYISVMCYDFHSHLYAPYITGHHANLFNDSNEPLIASYYHISCDNAIKYLTYLGVPPNKILLGVPSYAHSYGKVTARNHGLFQAFSPQNTPQFDKQGTGIASYITVLDLLKNGFKSYETQMNGATSAAYAYNPRTQQWLSYDNVDVIKSKGAYIKQHHLAGGMMWLLSEDTAVTDSQSLLKALYRNLQ